MHQLGNMLAARFTALKHEGLVALSTARSILASRSLQRPLDDLAGRVAPPFLPFVEAGVLAPWFTADHRLVLSGELKINTSLRFEAVAREGPLSALAMVGSCESLHAQSMVLSASIHDGAGSILARAPLRAKPLAGSQLLSGTFEPFRANPHAPIFIEVHRDDAAGAPWHVYHWRRRARSKKHDHQGFFGVIA
jgi:hypothetical protein